MMEKILYFCLAAVCFLAAYGIMGYLVDVFTNNYALLEIISVNVAILVTVGLGLPLHYKQPLIVGCINAPEEFCFVYCGQKSQQLDIQPARIRGKYWNYFEINYRNPGKDVPEDLYCAAVSAVANGLSGTRLSFKSWRKVVRLSVIGWVVQRITFAGYCLH